MFRFIDKNFPDDTDIDKTLGWLKDMAFGYQGKKSQDVDSAEPANDTEEAPYIGNPTIGFEKIVKQIKCMTFAEIDGLSRGQIPKDLAD